MVRQEVDYNASTTHAPVRSPAVHVRKQRRYAGFCSDIVSHTAPSKGEHFGYCYYFSFLFLNCFHLFVYSICFYPFSLQICRKCSGAHGLKVCIKFFN